MAKETRARIYAVGDMLYHKGRPILGAYYGRNGKVHDILKLIAELMNDNEYEPEEERGPQNTIQQINEACDTALQKLRRETQLLQLPPPKKEEEPDLFMTDSVEYKKAYQEQFGE